MTTVSSAARVAVNGRKKPPWTIDMGSVDLIKYINKTYNINHTTINSKIIYFQTSTHIFLPKQHSYYIYGRKPLFISEAYHNLQWLKHNDNEDSHVIVCLLGEKISQMLGIKHVRLKLLLVHLLYTHNTTQFPHRCSCCVVGGDDVLYDEPQLRLWSNDNVTTTTAVPASGDDDGFFYAGGSRPTVRLAFPRHTQRTGGVHLIDEVASLLEAADVLVPDSNGYAENAENAFGNEEGLRSLHLEWLKPTFKEVYVTTVTSRAKWFRASNVVTKRSVDDDMLNPGNSAPPYSIQYFGLAPGEVVGWQLQASAEPSALQNSLVQTDDYRGQKGFFSRVGRTHSLCHQPTSQEYERWWLDLKRHDKLTKEKHYYLEYKKAIAKGKSSKLPPYWNKNLEHKFPYDFAMLVLNILFKTGKRSLQLVADVFNAVNAPINLELIEKQLNTFYGEKADEVVTKIGKQFKTFFRRKNVNCNFDQIDTYLKRMNTIFWQNLDRDTLNYFQESVWNILPYVPSDEFKRIATRIFLMYPEHPTTVTEAGNNSKPTKIKGRHKNKLQPPYVISNMRLNCKLIFN